VEKQYGKTENKKNSINKIMIILLLSLWSLPLIEPAKLGDKSCILHREPLVVKPDNPRVILMQSNACQNPVE
jgi:hypothetical protein